MVLQKEKGDGRWMHALVCRFHVSDWKVNNKTPLVSVIFTKNKQSDIRTMYSEKRLRSAPLTCDLRVIAAMTH